MSFSSKFGSLFIFIRDYSSALFKLKLYMLLINVAHQSANFQTCHYLNFGTKTSSSSNFASLFNVMRANSSVLFQLKLFHLKLYMLSTKRTNKVQIFRLSTPCMKITQFLYVIFQATSSFSFKFCITFQCHST